MGHKQQKIYELEKEVQELREFVSRGNQDRDSAFAIFKNIMREHQPKAVKARGKMLFELRCERCHTDEHHTWGPDNYMPWPCPTIAEFVALATYEEPEKGGV